MSWALIVYKKLESVLVNLHSQAHSLSLSVKWALNSKQGINALINKVSWVAYFAVLSAAWFPLSFRSPRKCIMATWAGRHISIGCLMSSFP